MSAKEGTALAFYKICGDTLYINGCLGNIGIGTNEIAEVPSSSYFPPLFNHVTCFVHDRWFLPPSPSPLDVSRRY